MSQSVADPPARIKRKTGRKPKLTERHVELIARHVSRGLTQAEAARLVGIVPETLSSNKSRFAAIEARIENARAECLDSMLGAVEKAALEDSQGKGPDWRAAAWFAEHVYPQRFSGKIQASFNNCQIIAGVGEDLLNQIRNSAICRVKQAALAVPAAPEKLPDTTSADPA